MPLPMNEYCINCKWFEFCRTRIALDLRIKCSNNSEFKEVEYAPEYDNRRGDSRGD